MTGRFIVLEGPDGSGTTTHAKRLADAFRAAGYDVLLTAEPTEEPIGSAIRGFLSGKNLDPAALQLLFCADRADHLAGAVLPALNAGTWVVCDRYVPSTIAYGQALGLDRVWLEELNKKFVRPDALLLLLPPLSVCRERLAARRTRDSLESDALQAKVYDAYAAIAKRDRSIAVIDSSGTVEEVAREILARAGK